MADMEARSLVGTALGQDSQGHPVLRGARCNSCGTAFFPAAEICPSCGAEDIAASDMPRTGVLYSFTTVQAGPAKWRKPMRLGYVDLPNGVRVFSHLSGDGLAIGQTLELATAELADDADGPLIGFIFRAQEG
jgi:uncharacterized OB-fold protein